MALPDEVTEALRPALTGVSDGVNDGKAQAPLLDPLGGLPEEEGRESEYLAARGAPAGALAAVNAVNAASALCAAALCIV